MNCPNTKELPGICDGVPMFCRGCCESANRLSQLMSESRDEARAEVKALKLQVEELQKLSTSLRQDVSIKLGENMALEEDLKEKDRLNGEYRKALVQIVGTMQGSGIDKDVFEKVYDIAVMAITENHRPEKRYCAKCGIEVENTAHVYACDGKLVDETECPHCEGGQICTDTVDCNKCGATGKLPGPCQCKKCAERRQALTMSGCGHVVTAKDVLCPICGL